MARLLAVLTIATLAAGCGSSAGDPLDAREAAALRRQLGEARTAAIAADRPAAAAALRGFRVRVARLRRAERLDPARAEQLRVGARQAEVRVALEVAAPVAGPTPAPASSVPSRGEGNGKGKGKGKGGKPGKGDGEDDDDD